MAVGKYDCAAAKIQPEEYEEAADLKHKCQNCGRGFDTQHGLSVHVGRWCRRSNSTEYEVDSIADVRGTPEDRYYLVHWKGWAKEHDQWTYWRQCEGSLDAIDAFWDSSGLDRRKSHWLASEDGLRCRGCCRLCKTPAGLKIHSHKCSGREASRTGSRAEKVVQRNRRAAAHAAAGVVKLVGVPLKAAYTFKYLGIRYSADGDQVVAVETRLEQAANRYRMLGRIWRAGLSTRLKLRIYEAAVGSIVTYGCECWTLDPKTQVKVRAWNARRVAFILDKEIRVEYKTPTFDLVARIRARRLKWAGELLRREATFLPRKVALAEHAWEGSGRPSAKHTKDVCVR
jgi:hypothetical protein